MSDRTAEAGATGRPNVAGAPQPPERALNRRSLTVALFMVLLWTAGGCFLAVNGGLQPQQMLMVLGFGAILTVFLLQFPRLFLATVIVVWGGTIALSLTGSPPDEHERLITGMWRTLPVLALLVGLSVWLHLRPLKRGELVVVYAAVLITIPWCISIKAVLEASVANLFESQRRGEPQLYAWARELPWWGPTVPSRQDPSNLASTEAVRGFVQGNGGAVPWGLWWRPMLYWTAMCLAYEAMLMGLLMMFRRRWIEHERLPFVWAEPHLMLIGNKQAGANTRRGWVMFLLGLAICLPGILLISPTGEALSTWTVPPWATFHEGLRGGYDLTGKNILPGVPLRLHWGPLVLAMFLLFPVDVLMTVALTFIVLKLLLPGIMNSLGLQVGPVRLGQFTGWGLRLGGCIGLLVWSVWFNRRTLWGYLRSLWGAPPANVESTDDIPRRLILALAVGGMIAFIALGSYAASPTTQVPAQESGQWVWYRLPFAIPIQMICLTLLVLILAFAQARQRVEGNLLSYENNYGSHMMVSIQRDYLRDHYTLAHEGVQVSGSSWAAHWMQWGFVGQLKSYGAHNMLLEAFKVGHELRVQVVSIAKIIALSMLVVAAVTPVLYVQLMYYYGFENSYQGALNQWSSFTQWSERSASYGLNSTSSVFKIPADNFYDRYVVLFNASYGVIVMGIIFYLRREFPRFPLSPVGVVLAAETWPTAAGLPFSVDYVWFSFLLCWVAKSLIFRWLGVRYFREKLQPAIIMLLCGMVFGMMVFIFRRIALGQGTLK